MIIWQGLSCDHADMKTRLTQKHIVINKLKRFRKNVLRIVLEILIWAGNPF